MQSTSEVNTGKEMLKQLTGDIQEMTFDQLIADIEQVSAEVEEHRDEIEIKESWLAGCRARLATMTA